MDDERFLWAVYAVIQKVRPFHVDGSGRGTT
jgi:hypothetical protein